MNVSSQLVSDSSRQSAFFKQGQKITAAILLITLLSSCVTALVAGAAIATVDIIHDRRTAGGYIDDAGIELAATNYLLSSKRLRTQTRVKPQSWNGILLLTGEVDSQDLKQEVVEKVSSFQGVRQVVDETTIQGRAKLLTRTNDTWIASKVKSRLVLKTGIDANRIKVVVTRGSVYLMGIVTQEEADKATELARNIKGVDRVIKVFEYTDKASA